MNLNRSRLLSLLALLASTAALVGCDHVTKYAAKAELEHAPPRVLIASVLDLRYAENTDVAFNALRAVPERIRAPLLVAFGALAIVAIGVALLRWRGGAAARAALLLILAGALGNYLDRLLRGYVVDFIHVPHWPVFNVADILVCAGTALLAVTVLRRPPTGVESRPA